MEALRIPTSKIFARMDVELFIAGLIFVLAAIAFPAWNDLRIKKRHLDGDLPDEEIFRLPDYLKFLPFDQRRCWTTAACLALFGLVTVLLLVAVQNLWASILVISGYLWLAPILFKYAYGYRSHIIGLFGRTLFVTVVIGCLLNSDVAPNLLSMIPSQLIELLKDVRASISIQGTLIITVGTTIWMIGKRQLLVPEQYMGHTGYFLAMAVGHLVIYWIWIPLRLMLIDPGSLRSL
jgi:hypothetical protein